MAAPSYKGETVTARCPRCGCLSEIPAADGFSDEGNCPGPDGKQPCGIVDWDVWDGPVTTLGE